MENQTSTNHLTDAISLVRAGSKDEARQQLVAILRANPHDETAWLWLVETLATREERIRALETCLKFIPHSQTARRGLAALNADQPVAAPVVQAGQTAAAQEDPSATVTVPPRRYASPKRRRGVFGVAALFLLLAALAFALVWSLSGPKGTRAKEEISVQAEPVQTILLADSDADATPIAGRNLFVSWKMMPRATFRIAARVVGIKVYDDWQSAFVPLDLCLAWGDLGDPAADKWFSWQQYSRVCHERHAAGVPWSWAYIASHYTNIHVVPATHNLEAALDQVQRNDLVLLEGLLVDIEAVYQGRTGFVRTSLSRTDSDCEILVVQQLVVDGRAYR